MMRPVSREALGVPVCIKRDDLTGLAHGRQQGAQARPAVRGGRRPRMRRAGDGRRRAEQPCPSDRGGGRAARARRARRARRCARGRAARMPVGNVLLDVLLGASIECVAADDYDGIERAITDAATRLRTAGRTPYAIPIGGASPPGVAAYADAAHELRAQRPDVDVVFVADGSGGTHAGLLAGWREHGPRVIGVDVGTRPDLAAAVARMSGTSGGARDRSRPRRTWLWPRRRSHDRGVCSSRRAPKGSCSIPSTRPRQWPRS